MFWFVLTRAPVVHDALMLNLHPLDQEALNRMIKHSHTCTTYIRNVTLTHTALCPDQT